MSDEPKKRKLGWIGWSFIALVVLYPLSMGPVLWLHNHRVGQRFVGPVIYPIINTVYAPVMLAEASSESIEKAVKWYLSFWIDL